MALPSLGTPEFHTTIPSTGQEITYRPFLVKEEKILLMAMEGEDEREIQHAILGILEDCIITDVDVNKLAVFDIEYLFLKLRGKSVGEMIDLKIGHAESNCDHKTEVSINIDDIVVQGDITDGKVQLTDEIGAKLRYPTIADATRYDSGSPDGMFKMIASCVEFIYDQENVYQDFTVDEMVEWLGGLNQSAFQKVTAFFENLPKLSHDITWTCKKCGENETVKLEGLNSFFM
jgi:hypothetical protein